MQNLWRIENLCEQAAYILQHTQYVGQESARVREVPDVRTIRYYTTAGLIDRCSEMLGRTAYYGRRHLLQLIAIKRLQAQGLSLVEVQKKLLGATDAALKNLAGVTDEDLRAAANATAQPEHSQITLKPTATAHEPVQTAPRPRFWEQIPTRKPLPPGELATRAAVILPVAAGASLVLEGISSERLATLLPALETALAPLRTLLNQIHHGEPIDTQPFDKQAGAEHELPGESQEKSA